ncbi:MAG TPA: beta-N-acetylhexosaminidase [Bryobacteraceae bacterium]|nr:beta-N-acetylhexosaminidase [Bryobacteraceae bacterium]
MNLRKSFLIFLWCVGTAGLIHAATVSTLLARGYTVIPEPQKVELRAGDFRFGPDWKLELGAGVEKNSAAAEALKADLESRFHLSLSGAGHGSGILRLDIASGSVTPGSAQDRNRQALASQAYAIELDPESIRIRANAAQGLFYGVETLIQMLREGSGVLWLPAGEIVDWPDLEMRQLYWDDAHHLDRMGELKHAIRQAAFFKINGFAIKLEGHFQYRSAPAVVEPYALSPAELQELTDYGLHYFVQVIPYLDGPAHIAFILKHPEYAKLREFPDSNYELCVTNPDSYKLLFGMYDDLLAANKGVKYFYLSTDEPYYVGLADNSQCNEGARAKELGSVGKLLAEFTTKAADYLHDHGRTVVFWGEYPLKVDDIPALPKHIVNGEVYGPKFDAAFKAHGIRQMVYVSTEGEERMFPDYFVQPPSGRLHQQQRFGPASPRVAEAVEKISFDTARKDADLMGMIVAGWADPGVHPEAFWLGYATITAAGWHPGSPDPRESMNEFYSLFYGSNVTRMDRIYQLLSFQAQLWTDSWDTVNSTARKPIWGNSNAIYKERHPAHDQAIPLPPVPSASDLSYSSTWSQDNSQRLKLAEDGLTENTELLGLLYTNLQRADWNRYNLEVFLSIARLCQQNLEMLVDLGRIDRTLAGGGGRQGGGRRGGDAALPRIDRALDLARDIRLKRNAVYQDTVATWYKSWYPRVAEANGRKFLHEVDDVKDHVPDRTVDMSFLIYRELQLPLDDWYNQVLAARNQYAQAHQLPARTDSLNWKDLQ